jgi:uncharacterized DUF497 family protein
MRILGFDWDETNRRKIEDHDLDPDSAEELFAGRDFVVIPHPTKAERYLGLGFVPDGRFVVVVFDYDRETHWVRVVTAYEPTSPRWWRQYTRLGRKRR